MGERGCDGLPAQAGRLDFAGPLDAPFLKVLQKLRYRSEHVVQVPVEYYSQLDRAPSPRKQAGSAVSCRVGFMVMPLHLGFGQHGSRRGALHSDKSAPAETLRFRAQGRLAVNFQEVVHSVLAGKADVARHSDSRRTEWTSTRMPA